MVPAAGAADVDSVSIQALLRQSSASDSDLAAYYGGRNYRPLWIRSDGLVSEARRFVRAVGELAGERSPEALQLASAVEAARGGAPAALAQAELRLTRAMLAYSDDLPDRIDVGMAYIDERLEPRRSERRGNGTISSPRDVRALIEDLDRGNPVYRELRQGLAVYRLRWGSLPDVRVPGGSALRSGSRGSRVQALRRRLGLAERGNFDAALAQVLRAYKRTHGLPDTAVADARTIESLNRGPAHYERLIRANLARARAIPADAGERFVLVDAAAARLWMYEDGRPVDSMRVIVGKTREPTPMMAALIRYAAINPYWNLPPDLARVRAANVQRLGPSYLQREHYEVLSDWTDDAVVVHPSRVDWASVAAGRYDLRMRQLPGPHNMMGQVKLMMPNRFGVYLHDTPDRQLFNQADRWLSSGCIRLEDAWRLTRWVFGRDVAPRTHQPEERVDLRRRVPVYVTYLTAAPSEEGIVFRRDVYGRDAALLAQLDGRSSRLAAQ